jgi:hypothetical protein
MVLSSGIIEGIQFSDDMSPQRECAGKRRRLGISNGFGYLNESNPV